MFTHKNGVYTILHKHLQYFQMEVSANNSVIAHMLVYIKLIDNKLFTVLMVYPDDASGDVMLTAWKNSKFD